MAANRSKTEREQALERLSTLYLTGRSQRQIAQLLRVNQGTISRDLGTLQDRWQAAGQANLDMRKWTELAKIDVLERNYWRAWRQSRRDKQVSTAEKGTRGDSTHEKALKRVEGQVGNPAFLAGVQWCIDQRCKILGLVQKQMPDLTLNVNNSNQALVLNGMTLEEFKRLPPEEMGRVLRGVM